MTKYKSEQVQAGGSVSVTYGSGSGATFNAAYNSAKLNTAQVENQTSVNVGKGGLDVKVKGNTHLEGAVITSKADNANNRFQSGKLTTKEIENYSELKTKSAAVSGGSGGVNPMSALSLLGNKNESSQSTTHSAVSENINLTLTDDPNAETTLKQLNRDTQNANEKVTKHDISKVKETEEIVKGIGEISDKAMQIYTHSEREKIEQAKLELGKAKAQNASEQEIGKLTAKLNRLQTAYDKEYGTGSDLKQGVDAVTAALQGLAAKDVGQAAVGLASPYLNEQIKRHTENADGSVNTEANLIAHAILGAVEAKITGNNALAGAAAGASGEVAAMFITNTLYPNKKPSELTEAEKKNVTFLSQLAGGLAAGIVGDSTQAVVSGGDIAKRAVENNTFGDDISPSVDRKQTIESIAKAMFNGDEEKAEAYYDGIKKGESKSLIEGVEGTVEAIKNLDQTVANIADVIVNPKDSFNKIVLSAEEFYSQVDLALETDPKLAGELMGYMQGQSKALAAPTIVLTGEAAQSITKLAQLGVDKFGKLGLKQTVISNKKVGIDWSGDIKLRGESWEKYLQTTLPKGTIDLNKIKKNFKAFDHLLPDGTAISAKTMDTVGGYENPKRITYQLNSYVDDMVKFKEDGKKGGRAITQEQISSKEMYLAIPYGTSKEKMQAINKSMDYANSRGIKILVKEIK